ILRSVDDTVIGRVGVEIFEWIGIFGAAVLSHQVGAFEEFLEAKYVQKWTHVYGRWEQLGMLGDRSDHQKSAVAAAEDGELGGVRVFVSNQIFSGGEEVVENRLLFLKHAGMVPILAEFSAAPKIGVSENSAMLDPDEHERPGKWRFTEVEAAVASQNKSIQTVELQALLVKHKHGNAGLVLGGKPALSDFERRRM